MRYNDETVKTMALKLILSLCLGIAVPVSGGSPDPGQLKGKIVDLATQQPLICANIIIEGSAFAAATDTAGVYTIKKIDPGIYNIKFLMMGYETRLVNKVIVNPGRTTWQKIEMKSAGHNTADP